jgi:hypothetical protein
MILLPLGSWSHFIEYLGTSWIPYRIKSWILCCLDISTEWSWFTKHSIRMCQRGACCITLQTAGVWLVYDWNFMKETGRNRRLVHKWTYKCIQMIDFHYIHIFVSKQLSFVMCVILIYLRGTISMGGKDLKDVHVYVELRNNIVTIPHQYIKITKDSASNFQGTFTCISSLIIYELL